MGAPSVPKSVTVTRAKSVPFALDRGKPLTATVERSASTPTSFGAPPPPPPPAPPSGGAGGGEHATMARPKATVNSRRFRGPPLGAQHISRGGGPECFETA